MGALGAQIAVHRIQRPPQLASGLALEGGQECVNAIDADLRVLGLAVPGAPAQSLDLRDDHRLPRPSRRVLVRQRAGDLLQVLQPHGDVEPVEHRRRSDAGVGQDASEPGAAVGEGGQRRVPGPADGVEGAVDQPPMSVLTFATAPKTCRPPDSVSTLPIRTSRCHWPSSQLRMKVESKVTTIAFASTLTGVSAAEVIDRVLAIWKV